MNFSAAIGGFVLYNQSKIGPAGLVFGTAFSIVALSIIIYVCREREKIAVAIALIKEGSK